MIFAVKKVNIFPNFGIRFLFLKEKRIIVLKEKECWNRNIIRVTMAVVIVLIIATNFYHKRYFKPEGLFPFLPCLKLLLCIPADLSPLDISWAFKREITGEEAG